jgi:hypothetical protein
MRRFAFLLCLAAGCATTQSNRTEEAPAPASAPAAPAAPPAAAWKEAEAPSMEIEAARARELAPLAKQKLAAPSGSFTGEVEGTGEAKYESGDGYTLFTLPLGEASELMCFVYDHPIDTGSALRSIVQSIASDESLRIQRVYPTGVVESGGVPAVFLDVDYLAPVEGGMATGQAKLMVRASSMLPVLCSHDDVGFTESFRRITLDMAKGLVKPGEPTYAPPRYEEIQVVRLGRHAVGFEWWSVWDIDAGKQRTENTALLMMPRSPTQLMMQDISFSTTVDSKDRVLEMNFGKARDGELTVQMTVSRGEADTFHYEGTHGGKPVQGTFQSKRGLAHELSTAASVREKLLTGKEKELTFDFYRPSTDPTKPTEVVYRRAQGAPRAVTVTSEGATFTGTVDAKGHVEKVEMPLPGGSVKMTVERVFSRGEL